MRGNLNFESIPAALARNKFWCSEAKKRNHVNELNRVERKLHRWRRNSIAQHWPDLSVTCIMAQTYSFVYFQWNLDFTVQPLEFQVSWHFCEGEKTSLVMLRVWKDWLHNSFPNYFYWIEPSLFAVGAIREWNCKLEFIGKNEWMESAGVDGKKCSTEKWMPTNSLHWLALITFEFYLICLQISWF